MKEAATQKLTTNYINYNCGRTVELSQSARAKCSQLELQTHSIYSPASAAAVIYLSSRHFCHDLARVKMRSVPGSCGYFSARDPLHVPLSVIKSCVSRVTEDPRGLAEATDPKERRWDCWRHKCSLVGDQEEIISVNDVAVCVERL